MNRIANILVLTAASIICMPVVANAQEVAEQSTERDATNSTTSERGDIADIVVTARRVEERLQDVPISITVFDTRQIANRNLVEPRDLALYTPGLSTTGVFGRDNTQYAIRGFSQVNRTAASVATYFAEVVAPRSGPSIAAGDGAGPGQFLDLQNVQVLKGPQGTLFGRNTTGGAVLLVPRKPTDRFEGYVEGLYGSYDWKGVQGVVNAPLGANARLRLAADFQDREGTTRNFGVGPSRLDDRHYIALRASLVVDLTPNLENYTIVSYSKSDTNGSLNSLLACNGGSFPIGALACGTPATSQLARQRSRGVHTGENDLENPVNRRTQWGVINMTTWEASDNLTIKNIASYTELTSDVRYDVAGTNLRFPAALLLATPAGPRLQPTNDLAGTPITFVDSIGVPSTRHSTTDQYTASEEFQVQGRIAEGRLDWQAGLYIERSGPLGLVGARATQLLSCSNLGALQCTDPLRSVIQAGNEAALRLPPGSLAMAIPGIGSVSDRVGSISYRNLAVYGQATYALNDNFKVTGGIRYTSDKTSAYSSSTIYTFVVPNTPTPRCVKSIQTLENQCSASFSQKSEKPTWLVNIDYKPNDDTLLYAKYARGYRQGSVSVDAADNYETFSPETVDAYEVGAKLSLRGGLRGYFNVAAFYNDLKNQQLAAVFVPVLGNLSDGIVNAGKSRIYGAEIETALMPFEGLTLNGSYAYLNTRLQSIDPLVVDISKYRSANLSSTPGQELPQTPKHKFSGGVSYRLPLDSSIGTVNIGAIYSYTGSILFASGAGPFQRSPGYGTLNLNLNWDNVGGAPLDLSLFATNVTNAKYQNFVFGIFNGTGIEVVSYGEQRIVGAKVRYRFGRQ